jgi:hypothetical protein
MKELANAWFFTFSFQVGFNPEDHIAPKLLVFECPFAPVSPNLHSLHYGCKTAIGRHMLALLLRADRN